MNIRQFTFVGDVFPSLPENDGHLVLISMRFCPFAQRVHLILDAKQLDHHVVNVHLKQKPEWLTEYSRLGQVPALGLTNEPGKPYIHQSLVIADYLDEKYPAGGDRKTPLYPTDPLAKALDRLWIERFADVTSAYYQFALYGPDGNPAPGSLEKLYVSLDVFEAELKRRNTQYYGGVNKPGMLDYMIWPWFERLASLKLWTSEGETFEFSSSRYPLLLQFQADMMQDRAVQKTYLSATVHYNFIQGNKIGKPDYEMLSK